MKYRLVFIICTVGALFLNACSDFLKEESQSEVIPKTTTDFRELLLGSGYPTLSMPNMAFTSLMEDDMELFFAFGQEEVIGSSAAKQYFPTYTWQPYFEDMDGNGNYLTEYPSSTVYYGYYERIKGCNAVLDHIDDAIGPQAEKDRVKAEALAIRAFYYFQLVNLYGEPYNYNKNALGVPLKLTSAMDENYMPRDMVSKIYNMIVADLQEAARLTDPLPIIRKDYHINQPAIHILLSRVYLYMEDYQECVKEVEKVITMGGTLLNMPVLTASSYSIITYDNPEVEWLYGGNPIIDVSAYVVAPELRALYDETNDKRFAYYGFVPQWNGSILIYKTTRGTTELSQAIRTGEAYLNRAEAYALSGNATEALKDLNELRQNRIKNYTKVSGLTGQALVDEIRLERRKELCFEGHRWFDLRRYGMPSISHLYKNEKGESIYKYTLAEKDPMYTLPFPACLVLRNPALKQNPSATIGNRQGTL